MWECPACQIEDAPLLAAFTECHSADFGAETIPGVLMITDPAHPPID